MKIKKIVTKVLLVAMVALVVSPIAADARQIGNFSTFAVPVTSTNYRRVPQARAKAVTGRRGVVNLEGRATGSPRIHARMRNSAEQNRGNVSLLQGERITFATPGAEAGFNYWLWLRASGVANSQIQSVGITGSWSPDEH